MKQKGYFISLEGQDASGKSTIMRAVCDLLGQEGYKVKIVEEFSTSTIGDYIRSLLAKDKFIRFRTGRRSAFIETMLIIADLYYQDEMEILPLLADGTTVLKERHIDSIFACQIPKIADDYPGLTYEYLYGWITDLTRFLLVPNLTFLLSLPRKIQIERIKSRGENVSDEDLRVFEQREIIYTDLALKHKGRIVIFDNNKTLRDASIEIASIIKMNLSQ